MATDTKTTTENYSKPDPNKIDPGLVALANLLDEAFTIPGTNYRIGLDGLIGMIPIIGDIATGLLAKWMLSEAKRLGVPWHKRALITSYYGVDIALGFIPLVGDAFDIAFKSHKKSLKVIEEHLEKQKIYVKATPVSESANEE